MKEQIIFAGLMGKVGTLDTGCDRQISDATAALTQKYWEPAAIATTLKHCQKDVDSKFKAYFNKIQKYSEIFDITGTDVQKFLMMRFLEAGKQMLTRGIWFGDKAVAASAAAAAGLIAAGDVKYYNYFDGLWAQIFAAVTATTVKKYAITENTLGTTALQTTLAADRSVAIFEGVWALADPRLKADPDKQMLVSNEIFENYRQYLQKTGGAYQISLITDGIPFLMWNGVKIINMQIIWDLILRADFEKDSTNHLYYLPNRVVLTVPSNIPYGTLNENDFTELESFYDILTRQNYMALGFTLDAKLLEGYMTVVAY